MRILFLTHYFSPEVGPATKRIAGLSSNLKKIGHEVSVVTGFPNYPSGIKHKGYQRKLYMEEEIEGIKVYRYYMFSSPRKSTISRLMNYISFMFSCLFFIFNKNRYDVIITSSPPLFIGISGYILSRILRIPFVFDIRDIWPDIAAEMEELSTKSLIYKMMDSISKFLYANADLITVVTNMKKSKILDKGYNQDKVEVISNGFDKEFLDFPIDEELIERHKLTESFNIVYAGIVGLAQGLDIIIEVGRKLQSYTDIRFLIIGDGVEKSELEEKVGKIGLKNIEFLGLQTHEKIFTFLKHSGVSIVPLKSDKLQDSVPSKLYEALGVGCPVVLCAKGESSTILKESQGGIVVEPGDSEGLKTAILELYSNPQKRFEMSEKGQAYVQSNFTRDIIAKKLCDTLEKIL